MHPSMEISNDAPEAGKPATHNYASDDDAKEKQFPLLMMHGGGQAALSHTYLKI